MRHQLLRLLPLVLMLIVTIAIGMGLFDSQVQKPPPTKVVGMIPLYFEVPVVGSNDSAAKFSPMTWKGNVVLLNVFASWCEPCIAEHQLVMKLAQSGKVAVYGLAWKDDSDKVIDYIRKLGNPYQMIGLDKSGRTTVSLGLSGVPETYLFDHRGTIVYNHKAPLTEQEINTNLLPLIEKLRLQQANVPARR